MRNLSLAVIAIPAMLISIFSMYPTRNTSKPDFIKHPHGENFNISCNVCHSTKGWKIDKEIYSFNHDSTDMPLIGQHKQVDCKLCHSTLVFSEAKNQCVECHNDMHESTVGKDCNRCHTPQSWLVTNITQIHQQSRFPLVGVHAKVDCYECHKSETFQRFEVLGTECYSCHVQDYVATTEPKHSSVGYSTQCDDCHTVFSSEWTNSGFNHDFFPLTQGHALPSCDLCHKDGSPTKIASECLSCHQPDYSATTNPNHINANFSTDCKTCHTTAPGWKPANFDHNNFPLNQGHDINDCSKCHLNGNFSNASSECSSCHQPDYNASSNPNHVSGNFSTDCKTCHTIAPGWQPATFDHVNFPLNQGHNIADCEKCHLNGNFTNTSSECLTCHQPDFNASINPNHVSGNFSTDCKICHTLSPGWQPATFDHVNFPLNQGHNISDCMKCHVNGVYSNTSSDCISCHQSNYNATTNPNHISENFSADCKICHTLAPGWTPATFDHVNFPLTQGHNISDCAKCHVNNNYANLSSDCKTCHQPDYNATTDPNHLSANFPTDCKTCHTTAPGWTPATFDHSKFPLTQGHNLADCNSCHSNGNYTNLSPECISCHQPDYNATVNPNHLSANFPTDCKTCHSTAPGWKPATFNHSMFPLTQGHNINDCAKCHVNGNYTNLSSDCKTCHQADYNSTTNPNHLSANFPTDCKTCHTTAPGWKPATFNHSMFPLTQGHNINDCAKCHVNGNYTNLSSDCKTCHQSDYNATTNPNHLSANFPTDCKTCHSTAPGWKPATFNHSMFPLTQGHNISDCSKCHVNGNYTNLSSDCKTCHQADYNATTNPNHLSGNFPTECKTCHTTAPGWRPATFNHATFPLTQGHNISDCSKCHLNGNYSNTSSDCKTCHQADYNATSNPSHSALNFSTTCTQCHTTVPGWKPAKYTQHDALSFPIYSGEHRGEWNSCSDCHANPGNYKVFSCIDCHEHNKTDMDNEHNGEGGYAYNSSSCFTCHPQGKAD